MLRVPLLSAELRDYFLENRDSSNTCPLCRARDKHEKQLAQYVTGSAMMEPSVREETNRLGFCPRHISDMLNQRQRHPAALVISSLLSVSGREMFKNSNSFFSDDKLEKRFGESCFTCEYIEKGLGNLAEAIIMRFLEDSQFKEIFCRQKYFCLPHYNLLSLKYDSLPRRRKKEIPDFMSELNRICREYMKSLTEDIQDFCLSFDYRNAGKPLTDKIKFSAERAAEFWTGRKPEILE